jgi:hypothetical protein
MFKANDFVDEVTKEYCDRLGIELPESKKVWREILMLSRILELFGMDKVEENVYTTKLNAGVLLEILEKYKQIE